MSYLFWGAIVLVGLVVLGFIFKAFKPTKTNPLTDFQKMLNQFEQKHKTK